MGALTIKNARKSYGSTEVLKGVDIEIDAGQFLILVGPSGCGKSTLLNMIAGLETITSGEIHIGGRVVNDLSPKDRDIAMVFQSYALYPNMSVRENISFGLDIRKVPKNEQTKIVDNVSQMLQIGPLLDRKPSQLSGGQRQRVAMGRALARKPTLFLFDEPLSNLDAKLRVEMRTEIKLLHARMNTTIVYVTHDQIEAMTLGDRIAVMFGGEVQQFGSPYEVYNNPSNMFVAGFIGSPSMNFIRSTVVKHNSGYGVKVTTSKDQSAVLPIEGSSAALQSYVDKDVVFGIRPEHITNTNPNQPDEATRHVIPCPVDMNEPTGPDTLIFTMLNGQNVVARSHPDEAQERGSVMDLTFDMSKAVLFDRDTEKRIV